MAVERGPWDEFGSEIFGTAHEAPTPLAPIPLSRYLEVHGTYQPIMTVPCAVLTTLLGRIRSV